MLLQIIASGLLLGGVYALLSIGLSLILGVSKFINFAYGDFVMVGTYMAFMAYTTFGTGPYFSWPLIIIGGAIFGMLFYYLVKKTIGGDGSNQVLITIGLAICLQNLVLMFFKSDYKSIPAHFGDSIQIGEIYLSMEQLVTFTISILITLALMAFIKFTPYGRAMRAVGQDPMASSLMGINITQVNIATFCLATVFACLAGSFLMSMYSTFPQMGATFNIVAWVCVIMGGIGNLTGALIAGFIIGVLETLTGFYLGSDIRQAVYYAVFILCVVLRPEGLFKISARGLKKS